MNNFLRKIGLEKTLLIAWRNQFSQIRLTLLIGLAIASGAILAVYLLSLLKGVPPAWLSKDPAETTGVGPYIGMLSTLGIMAWAATTAICFWAALLLRLENRFSKSAVFLFISGFLCLLLTFDDAFMLHEGIFPKYFDVPEKVICIGYLLIIAGWGGYFFRQILKTEYFILVLAAFFLGLSVAIDLTFPSSDFKSFLEDCPKFFGIVFWLAYFSRTALAIVRANDVQDSPLKHQNEELSLVE
ncbi:MAG: hypothetical protein JXA78_08305 [Anaerolineales bacterium]|nr:hypothetical protein [Anaerolineales bacterium]